MKAAGEGHKEVVELLLAAGANIESETYVRIVTIIMIYSGLGLYDNPLMSLYLLTACV